MVRRADDWPEAVGRRMAEYERETDPVLRWYEAAGVLERVDGLGAREAVANRVTAVLDRRLRTSVS